MVPKPITFSALDATQILHIPFAKEAHDDWLVWGGESSYGSFLSDVLINYYRRFWEFLVLTLYK